MTRGTLFYYESDEEIYSSTEFNGDMYHGTPDKPEGRGDEVIKLMANLESLDDFKNVLAQVNKHYRYEEGNDCFLVSDKAIADGIAQTIKYIDEERPDLKGDNNLDPRTFKTTPTFKDTRTWKFWGIPNLSDYSYIYNNSGKELLITTKSKTPGMIIPDGGLGILNYGSNDCICKDGAIIDGMGNYEESTTPPKDEPSPLTLGMFYNYLIENFTLDGTSRALIRNIFDHIKNENLSTREAHILLSKLLDGIGIEDIEIERIVLDNDIK